MKSRVFPILLIVGLTIAGLTLSACNRQPQHEDLQLGQSAIHKASGVGQIVADSAIATRIETQLATDGALAGSPIHVAVHHGKVTLTGTVSSENAREQAGKIAAGTEGVKGVANKIQVVSGD